MQETETVDPLYIKGFNEGYIIKQDRPDLANQLVDVKSNSSRITGFKDGIEQVSLEQTKERYPSWLRSDRISKLKDEPDKSKDRDDFDDRLE